MNAELEDLDQPIRNLIAGGEGPTVEFKASMRYDYKAGRANTELTKLAVRTLAAFLNSHGGTLLIGVDDEGNLLDLEQDIATLGKKNLDGFQLTLRSAISAHLGAEVDSYVTVDFTALDGKRIAVASCSAHQTPVYFVDGARPELCVRSGNLTRSLDVRAGVAYVASHWAAAPTFTHDQLRAVVSEAVGERLTTLSPRPTEHPETIPTWLHLATRRVLDMFLGRLSGSHGWKRLYIVSPWISEISGPLATLNFDQLLHRLRDDRTTAYVVTRPPIESWHARAVERLAESGRASIALLPELHVKLYTAQTLQSSFALIGSANFTSKSLANREIGVLVSAYREGKSLFRELDYEAAEIYRHPQRELLCTARV